MVYYSSGNVKFPKHFNENPTTLKITNELSGKSYSVNLSDLDSNPRYYLLNLSVFVVNGLSSTTTTTTRLSGVVITKGTYRYEYGSERGLLQVGDYTAQKTEYNVSKTNKVYER